MFSYRVLRYAAFLAVLVLTPAALAQHAKPDPSEPRFGGLTEAEVEALTPTSPNPYTNFLPHGVEPDYRYWKARLALDASRRAERRNELDGRAGGLEYEEEEPEGESGQNDFPATAEPIDGFGTGEGDNSVLTISGSIADSDFTVENVIPFPEDDGSITFASTTELTIGEGIFVENAEIGNGPFGATSGDFDFYEIVASEAGQFILADVDTPTGGLDPYIALYDDAGVIIAENDDSDGLDSFLSVSVPAPGAYYLAVFAFRFNPFIGDPFDSGSGPGAASTGPYNLTLGLIVQDVDFYAFELEAGDILGVGPGSSGVANVAVVAPDGTLLIGSGQDASGLYPEDSPLPSGGISTVAAATIASETGTYALGLSGDGPYSVGVSVFRPRTETEPGAVQTLFVDFDSAQINAVELFGGGNPNAVLSALSTFIENWGLTPDDEDDLIDAIMANLEENLSADLLANSSNPDTDVILLNSRDDPEPPAGEPYVSRLIVGGTTDELGIQTIGIASTIDPGNFGLEDTGVILLDLLSESAGNPNSLNSFALAPGAEKLDLVAQGVGNIATHEAGHFLGLYHTDQFNELPTIIDQGGNLPGTVGVGPDLTFGTADDVDVDFVPDTFNPNEGFVGIEDQLNIIAFGLSSSVPPVAVGAQPDVARVASLYPNPLGAGGAAVLSLRSTRDEAVRVTVYDVAGRLVHMAFEGRIAPGQPQTVRIKAAGLAAGTYLVRIDGEYESATRQLTIVR